MGGIYEFEEEDAFRFAKEINAEAKRKGTEYQFKICPYCLGGNGSKKDMGTFSINLRTGQFKCLRATCNAHGNMITLAKDFNFSLGTYVDEYYNNQRRFRNIHKKERPVPKPAAVAYMESRGISEVVTNRYNLTVQRDAENILVFPFYDENGILQFVKYRKTDFDREKDKNKEWCEKDCKPILFGMNNCNFDNPVLVLTEGQIDSLSVTEAGIENAVSVPTGAKGFTWIPYCWDFLARFETLIVFGDHENGNITLLEEMKTRFHGTVKHVRPADYLECKDANDILRKHGKEAVRDAIQNAVPVENPKIKYMEDVKRVDLSDMEKITTGFDSLDKILGGFYFGQVVLVTGERGLGKSTLVSQFGTFAIDAGYPVMFYSGELMDWYFKAWIEFQMAGAAFINQKVSDYGYQSYSVQGQVLPLMEKWYSGKAFIYDNGILSDGETEEETLLETLESSVTQYGCRVLVIDNLMTAISDDMSSDLYRLQTEFVKKIARIAKKYNVLVFLVVHPRKSNGTEFGNDDVAGSSNITNLVDVVLRYSRPRGADIPADTNERLLSVHKNRLTGRTCRDGITMYYQESSKRISETESFDWKLGWDSGEFIAVDDDPDLPFE